MKISSLVFTLMPRPKLSPPSEFSSLDLNLPVPQIPLASRDLPLGWVQEINARICEETVYDKAYFERSLAGKCRVPFKM